MNKTLWSMLNSTEQDLLRQADDNELSSLDEDGLAELHDRIRRARNKYSKLYRRRAGAQVQRDETRAGAHARHARTAAKAEVFEDALARVSRHLSRAARAAAAELRAERLAAARRPSRSRRKVAKKTPTAAPASRRRNAKVERKTPATKRARASTRATTQRSQVRRDSR